MEFDDVDLTRDGVVVYADPQGANRRLAILGKCASFGLNINGFNLSLLSPYNLTTKVVFLQCPHPKGDIYKGPYNVEIIN